MRALNAIALLPLLLLASCPETGGGEDGDDAGSGGPTWEGLAVGEPCDGTGECGAGVVEALTDSSATCSTMPDGSAAEDQAEACDGLDNNCDGDTDELVVGAPLASRTEGVCAGSAQVCSGGSWVEPDYTTLNGYEASETSCDGLDNDCDGSEDNIAAPPPADRATGVCAGATKICDASGWVEPDYSGYAGYEVSETSCDGLDNDCDGSEDNIPDPPPADHTDGVCVDSTKVCGAAGSWDEPDYSGISGYEAVERTCDGDDNDCDGAADEDCVCEDINSNGFFADCTVCTAAGRGCDQIDVGGSIRRACDCGSPADCPCGLDCGCVEIAPNVNVCGLCTR